MILEIDIFIKWEIYQNLNAGMKRGPGYGQRFQSDEYEPECECEQIVFIKGIGGRYQKE